VDDRTLRDSNLIAASIDLLFEGLEVLEDIYDAEGSRLLVKRGVILSAERLGSLRNLNSGSSRIYVTGNTYKLLIEKSPRTSVNSRREMEAESGYAQIKDNTFALLDEIAHTKTVKQDVLMSVSTELSDRLEVNSPSLILSLINALAPVDEYLQRHCVNVGLLNGLQGQWLGLKKKDVDELVLIGLLHDCGKALIPPKVLNVPRKLTLVEYEVIKMHAVYSYELLGEFHETVRHAARCHHEKVNGDGYPDGLPPGKIGLEARITAISDIYDAMVSQRAYKRPRSPFNILSVISKLKDSELDARLVDVFIRYMPQELLDKQVMMSNGSVGSVHEIDPEEIEYPMIKMNGSVIKSDSHLYCLGMYNDD